MGRGKGQLVKFAMYIGKGNGAPLHYSCLANPMDRGPWWVAVYGTENAQSVDKAAHPEWLMI